MRLAFVLVISPARLVSHTGARARPGAHGHAGCHHRRFHRRRLAGGHGHRHRHRSREQGGHDRTGESRHRRRGDRAAPRSRPLCDSSRVRRLRNAAAARRAGPQRRQQAGADAADRGSQGNGHRRPGQTDGGRRSARLVVRHDAHARTARSAVGRSRRVAAAVAGHGWSGRGHQGRQLRRRRAAEQIADSIDPHLARSVRGRASQPPAASTSRSSRSRASGRFA